MKRPYDPEGSVFKDRVAHPHSLCEGKNRYNKKEANRVKGYVGRARDKDLRAYHCPKCHGYHLTKKRRDHDY